MGHGLFRRPGAPSSPVAGAGRDVRLGVAAGVLVDEEAAHVDGAGD